MKNFLLVKFLRFLGAKMDGYKSFVGGAGMILTGVLGLLGHVFPDQEGLPKMDLDVCLGTISGGLYMIGNAHKQDKTRREMMRISEARELIEKYEGLKGVK